MLYDLNRCDDKELDQFEEVDLTYLSSTTLTIRYETIPAFDSLISIIVENRINYRFRATDYMQS